MPRYYFHVHDGRDWPDSEGIELPDESAARGQAVIAAGEMLRELGHRMWKAPEWVMDVVDENGTRVCRLRFRAES